jgi:hypothetical protein
MPEANSAPILSNPASRYPNIVPGSAQKPNLLVHGDVRTTMIHAHVPIPDPAGVRSPVDGL